MFTEYDFLDRFKVAKKYGFSAVEIQFPYEFPLTKVLAAKESAGVEITLINIGAGEEYTIRDFAKIISDYLGYDANNITYDESKYVGAK